MIIDSLLIQAKSSIPIKGKSKRWKIIKKEINLFDGSQLDRENIPHMHAMSENPPKTLVRSAERNPRWNEEFGR